jgi:hypothetical protein
MPINFAHQSECPSNSKMIQLTIHHNRLSCSRCASDESGFLDHWCMHISVVSRHWLRMTKAPVPMAFRSISKNSKSPPTFYSCVLWPRPSARVYLAHSLLQGGCCSRPSKISHSPSQTRLMICSTNTMDSGYDFKCRPRTDPQQTKHTRSMTTLRSCTTANFVEDFAQRDPASGSPLT